MLVYRPRPYALLYPDVFRQNRAWSRAALRRAGVAETDVAPLWHILAQSRRLLRELRGILARSASPRFE